MDQVGLRGEAQGHRRQVEFPATHRGGGAGAFEQFFAAAQRLGLLAFGQARGHVVAQHLVRALRREAQEDERAQHGDAEHRVGRVGLAEQLQAEQAEHRRAEAERGPQVESRHREAAGGHARQHDDAHRLVQRVVAGDRQGAGEPPHDAVQNDAEPVQASSQRRCEAGSGAARQKASAVPARSSHTRTSAPTQASSRFVGTTSRSITTKSTAANTAPPVADGRFLKWVRTCWARSASAMAAGSASGTFDPGTALMARPAGLGPARRPIRASRRSANRRARRA